MIRFQVEEDGQVEVKERRSDEGVPALRPESESAAMSGPMRNVLLAQSAYFVVTGLWSLFAVNLFQRITGPKTDVWLVKTVGVLVTVIGAALGVGAWRRRVAPEVVTLATGSAAALAGIDIVYVAKRRIRPIYLLDAVAEVGLIGAMVMAGSRGRRKH